MRRLAFAKILAMALPAAAPMARDRIATVRGAAATS
jgi:hypothetical protein